MTFPPLLRDLITMNVVKMQRTSRHNFALILVALCLNAAHAQGAGSGVGAVAQPVLQQTDLKLAAVPTTAPTLKEDPKYWAERVKTRSQARWQLLAEKKYAETHVFLSGASKSFLPLEQYSAYMAGANYADGSVGDVECNDDSCTVVVLAFVLQRIPRVPQQIRTPLQLRERWIVEDGEAHLLQR